MRRLYLFLFLGLSASLHAQTSVTATITDSDSQTWNNGTWTASLVSPSGPPQGCTTATTVSGTMSGSGVITGSLCDNSLVGPSGSTWRFTICPNASAACSQVSTAVTGATQNLSSVLSAGVTAPRFTASFGAHGYLDVEVLPAPPAGGTYYNVTTPAFRQWTGSAWATLGSGSSFITSLTTTGSSGAATVAAGVLNIPVYATGCIAIGTVGTVQAATGSGGLCQGTSITEPGGVGADITIGANTTINGTFVATGNSFVNAFTVLAGLSANTISVNGGPTLSTLQPALLTGTTGSIGGSLLAPGACVAGTATVTGATTSMTSAASPSADPDSTLSTGIAIYSFVSASNTVTVRVCALVSVTPAATTYNVRVIQ